jgi:hypothetical protein
MICPSLYAGVPYGDSWPMLRPSVIPWLSSTGIAEGSNQCWERLTAMTLSLSLVARGWLWLTSSVSTWSPNW